MVVIFGALVSHRTRCRLATLAEATSRGCDYEGQPGAGGRFCMDGRPKSFLHCSHLDIRGARGAWRRRSRVPSDTPNEGCGARIHPNLTNRAPSERTPCVFGRGHPRGLRVRLAHLLDRFQGGHWPTSLCVALSICLRPLQESYEAKCIKLVIAPSPFDLDAVPPEVTSVGRGSRTASDQAATHQQP
jgi:hypothetical protein